MFAGFTHQPAVDLAAALSQLLPGDLSRVFFSDDGSTSVEVALKIAYQYWVNRGERRRRVLHLLRRRLSRRHARRHVARARLAASSISFRDLMCQVAVLPFPYTFEGDEAAEDREKRRAVGASKTLLAERDARRRRADHRADAARRRRHAHVPSGVPQAPGRDGAVRPACSSSSTRWRPALGGPARCSPWSRPASCRTLSASRRA